MRVPPLVARIFARDAAWGVMDQAVVSGTNFCVGLAVARHGGPGELGLWTIGFAILLLGVGFQRALATDPLIILEGRSAQKHALGRFLVQVAAGNAVLVVAALVVSMTLPSHRLLAGAVAVSLFPFLLQDVVRALLLIRRGARSVAANDTITGLTQVLLVVALPVGAPGGVAALGGGCIVGLAAGAIALNSVRTHGAPQVGTRALWSIGRWFGLDGIAYTVTNQLIPVLAAATAGAVALGSIRASLTLFVPFQLLFLGLNRIWLRDFALMPHDRLSVEMSRFVRPLLSLSVAWGVLTIAAGPAAIRLVYGNAFQIDRSVLVFLAVWAVLQCWYSMGALKARAQLQGRRLVGSRVCAGSLSLLVLLLLGSAGAPGIAFALALGQAAGASILAFRSPYARRLDRAVEAKCGTSF